MERSSLSIAVPVYNERGSIESTLERAGSLLFLEKAMDVTFGVLFMTAVMVMAIGLLADLIDKRLG